MAGVFSVRSHSGWDAMLLYIVVAIAAAGAVLVGHFGFHAEWAQALLDAYRP